jgi:pimeloyl-ACP methyl ester carboxylesterase
LGDLAVALADSLASQGILTVRIDLPGLGDSEGDLVEDTFSFVRDVQEGVYAEIAAECLERVQSHLGLKRVILGGHCGGAVTGFFVLQSHRTRWLAGMFALDVAFNLVTEVQARPASGQPAAAPASWRARWEILRDETRLALLSTPLGAPVQRMANRSRELVSKWRRAGSAPAQAGAAPTKRKQLPDDANMALLRCVHQVVRSGLPVLFVNAEDPRKRDLEFDYIGYLLARRQGRAQHRKVVGTDHAFLTGGGKPRVIEQVANWILGEFGTPSSPTPPPSTSSVVAEVAT